MKRIRLNEMVQKTLKERKYIFEYVYTKQGFRKGIVMASPTGNIAWSLVSRQDYRYQTVSINQIKRRFLSPIEAEIASMIDDKGKRGLGMFFDFSEKAVLVPSFDKNVAFDVTLGRLLMRDLTNAPNTEDGEKLIADEDLVRTVEHILDRANRYYKKAK